MKRFFAFSLLSLICFFTVAQTVNVSFTGRDADGHYVQLSPFSLNQFEQGYTFNVGNRTASTPEELQQIYLDLGSTEMYVRIATKRHVTADNFVDGVETENANVHTFDQAIRLCQIAA